MNRQFEIIEKVAIHMADNFFDPVSFPDKIHKLEEEFAELMEQLTSKEFTGLPLNGSPIIPPDNILKVKDEMGDVLYVLLHISNHLGFTASDLLHHGTMKMLARVKDPNYKK